MYFKAIKSSLNPAAGCFLKPKNFEEQGLMSLLLLTLDIYGESINQLSVRLYTE
jgi:hypothetical protein